MIKSKKIKILKAVYQKNKVPKKKNLWNKTLHWNKIKMRPLIKMNKNKLK